jgi:hypothetical protein
MEEDFYIPMSNYSWDEYLVPATKTSAVANKEPNASTF